MLRFKRQHGYITLGQPGLDHAGIATQIVVAQQLHEKGISWKDLGRDAFLKKVWEWKEISGKTIINQLTRMGMSVDMERVRFSLDEASSKAVLQAFTRLYREGIIYKAKRIVNWDPVFKTAISDLEISHHEEKGTLWYIRYPFADDSADAPSSFITIATTRPETLFGDQAVIVHPEDQRYQHLIGRQVHLPLTNRIIPILADSYSDPSKGSGAMKITPAHDFNDFDVGKRLNLAFLSIMDESACLNDSVPEQFRGLPREEARRKVLQYLEEKHLLEKTESILHTVPYNDRSHSVIEPRLTDQWFLDTKPLAEKAIRAVEQGQVRFVPEMWSNTYFDWLRNIQPWCLSRQLWWGHQIPVWYAPNGEMFCAETEEEAYKLAAQGKKENEVPPLVRDPDVLDTWFSSALWPFSTLGWPQQTEDLQRYFPTTFLSTGFDIIFFWVARMIMMSLHFLKKVPFHTVYINPLIRDQSGKKMSKSKGNVVDPLTLMEEYGTDALRLTLASLAIPGRDVRLQPSFVEINRNFITKIWNAAKFLEKNRCQGDFLAFLIKDIKHPLNLWVVRRLVDLRQEAEKALQAYRSDLFTQAFQRFLKEVFCDVYIEGIKTYFQQESVSSTEPPLLTEFRQTASFVWKEFLKIAHPVIPFVTDVLWEEWQGSPSILIAPWLAEDDICCEENILAHFYIDVAREIRSLKGLLDIAPTTRLSLFMKPYENDAEFLEANSLWIKTLGGLDKLCIEPSLDFVTGIAFIFKEREFLLTYPASYDRSHVPFVLQRKISALQKDILKLQDKTRNAGYQQAQPELWAADQACLLLKQKDLQKWEQLKI
jgi:valyl-tRNA synthetase